MSAESVRNSELASRAMDKAQKKLVPFILLMYILAFLDRANLGFAKQAFQVSTGVSDAAFALGAGIFFVGYAIFEVPSNIILHYVGARTWLARIMVTWGIVAAGFAWVSTENAFLVLRVLLGIAEAGFFPGIIYYFTFWFTARRRSSVMGMFYLGAPLAFIFGSPLSGLLMEMDGVLGFLGWQWLFAVEGLMASVVGVWAYWYLVDRPQNAKWIPDDEKAALIAELEAENANKPKEKTSALRVLANPKVWFLCSIYFMIQISVYGVTFYLPTQVAGLLGKKVGVLVGFVSAIPWVCALIANLTIPRFSDRSGKRGILAAVLMCIAGIGVVVSATGNPYLGILGLCIGTAGYFSCQPIFWTMPARFLTVWPQPALLVLSTPSAIWGDSLLRTCACGLSRPSIVPRQACILSGAAAFIAAALFLASIAVGMGKNTEKLSKETY